MLTNIHNSIRCRNSTNQQLTIQKNKTNKILALTKHEINLSNPEHHRKILQVFSEALGEQLPQTKKEADEKARQILASKMKTTENPYK